MPPCNTEQSSVVAHHRPAELGDVVIKVNQVFGLLVGLNIIKMNILVSPLEVMDYSLVREFLFYYENILEKFDNSFFDVEMVKLSDHGLLVF
jgi:hypothetical protein